MHLAQCQWHGHDQQAIEVSCPPHVGRGLPPQCGGHTHTRCHLWCHSSHSWLPSLAAVMLPPFPGASTSSSFNLDYGNLRRHMVAVQPPSTGRVSTSRCAWRAWRPHLLSGPPAVACCHLAGNLSGCPAIQPCMQDHEHAQGLARRGVLKTPPTLHCPWAHIHGCVPIAMCCT
jgi:hypothetical protein